MQSHACGKTHVFGCCVCVSRLPLLCIADRVAVAALLMSDGGCIYDINLSLNVTAWHTARSERETLVSPTVGLVKVDSTTSGAGHIFEMIIVPQMCIVSVRTWFYVCVCVCGRAYNDLCGVCECETHNI